MKLSRAELNTILQNLQTAGKLSDGEYNFLQTVLQVSAAKCCQALQEIYIHKIKTYLAHAQNLMVNIFIQQHEMDIAMRRADANSMLYLYSILGEREGPFSFFSYVAIINHNVLAKALGFSLLLPSLPINSTYALHLLMDSMQAIFETLISHWMILNDMGINNASRLDETALDDTSEKHMYSPHLFNAFHVFAEMRQQNAVVPEFPAAVASCMDTSQDILRNFYQEYLRTPNIENSPHYNEIKNFLTPALDNERYPLENKERGNAFSLKMQQGCVIFLSNPAELNLTRNTLQAKATDLKRNYGRFCEPAFVNLNINPSADLPLENAVQSLDEKFHKMQSVVLNYKNRKQFGFIECQKEFEQRMKFLSDHESNINLEAHQLHVNLDNKVREMGAKVEKEYEDSPLPINNAQATTNFDNTSITIGNIPRPR